RGWRRTGHPQPGVCRRTISRQIASMALHPYARGWNKTNVCIRLGASADWQPEIPAMFRPRHLACAVALALASSAAFAQSAPAAVQPSAHAGLFDNVVVFGDSLSDDGNLSLALQLPQIVRFTTNPGQTGVEDVAGYFGIPIAPALAGGTDFAFGGAGILNNSPGTPSIVPTLPTQLG